MRYINKKRGVSIWGASVLGVFLVAANLAEAQTPSPALLVLEKSDNMLAIVDPTNLQIVARVPAGPDPHEIVASPNGKLAYISNYGGSDSTLNTISVVDVAARKALAPINLGPLRSAHGLAFAGGKLYFTAETNKIVGRYDPATQSVDLVLGNAQDATVTIIDVASKRVTQTVPIPVKGANRLKFTPDGKRVLSSGLGAGAGANLVVLDSTTRKELKTVDLGGGAAGILIVPDGSRAYVAVSAKDKVAVVDLKSLEVTGYVSTGRQPDGLAWMQ